LEDHPGFAEAWSAADNVALPLTLAGQARRATEQDVNELLSFVGLAAEADTRAGALSLGQRRQLALARALVAKPDLILADEPAAGFSPEAAGTVVSTAGAAGAAAGADSTAAGAESAAAVESPARPFVSALKMRIERPRPRAASGSRFAPKSSRMRATMMSHSQPFIFVSMVHPSLGGDVI
jgi:hypothetical protein